MKKRLLTIFLVVGILATVLPTTALAAAPDGYTADDTETMAYYRSSGSTTIDVKGKYNDNWLKTTYNNNGYAVATSGLDDATVSASADFINNGQYVQLSYTVTAGSTAISGGKLAVHADVQIGDNDRAAVEVIQDGGKVIGLKMVDDHSNEYDCVSENAQFNLYFDGTGGVTPVDTYWFGHYSERDDSDSTYGHIYFAPLNDSTKSSSYGTYMQEDGIYTKFTNADSGFAVSWQNIALAANESKTFSFILGVGEKADPPVWGSEDGKPISLTLAADVGAEQSSRQINVSAKVTDAAGLTDTLYYSVDGGTGTALGSVEADGSLKAITGQLDLSSYTEGTYTFSFWVVNSKGAASASVNRTVTISADGTVSGLDDSEEQPPAPGHYTVTFNANGASSGQTFTRQTTGSGEVQSVSLERPDGFAKDGCTFMGWSNKPNYAQLVRSGSNTPQWNSYDYDCGDGNGRVKFYSVVGSGSPSTTALTEKDITLYAVWAENTLDVDDDGSGDYPILSLAGKNVSSDATIKALQDYTDLTYLEQSDHTLILDLNGKKITDGSVMVVGGSLTIMGGGTLDGGAILASGALTLRDVALTGMIFQQTGTLTVESGTFGGLLKYGGQQFDGTTSLQGGTFQAMQSEEEALLDGRSIVYYDMSAADGADAINGLKAMLASGKVFSQADDLIKTEQVLDDGDPVGWIAYYEGEVRVIPDGATSEPAEYRVTVTAVPAQGGTAAGSGTYGVGTPVTVTAVPASGYRFVCWVENGGEVSTAASYTFTLTREANLTAEFSYVGSGNNGSSVMTYPVAVEDTTHGTAKADRTHAASGTTVTITVTPDDGCTLDGLTVTDKNGREISVKDRGNGKYIFTMPASKVTVSVTFAEIGTSYSDCLRDEACPIWPFADASTTAWYHDGVHYCIENSLMSGYGSGLFGPNDSLSRAQLAQILYNKEAQPRVTGGSGFTDVADGAWYADAVTWAAANGIVAGYGNSLFRPNDPITREQLAVMLWRYAKFKGCDTTQGGMIIREFSDYESISGYAMDAMTWAVNTGIIGDYEDQTLHPQANATRAQAAQMLKNFLEHN